MDPNKFLTGSHKDTITGTLRGKTWDIRDQNQQLLLSPFQIKSYFMLPRGAYTLFHLLINGIRCTRSSLSIRSLKIIVNWHKELNPREKLGNPHSAWKSRKQPSSSTINGTNYLCLYKFHVSTLRPTVKELIKPVTNLWKK